MNKPRLRASKVPVKHLDTRWISLLSRGLVPFILMAVGNRQGVRCAHFQQLVGILSVISGRGQGLTICCFSVSISFVSSSIFRSRSRLPLSRKVKIACGITTARTIRAISPTMRVVTSESLLSILSFFMLIYSFIRSSEAWIFVSIFSMSWTVNSPRAGKAIAEKSIVRTSIVFMGCFQCQFDLSPCKGGRVADMPCGKLCSATQTGLSSLSQIQENYKFRK